MKKYYLGLILSVVLAGCSVAGGSKTAVVTEPETKPVEEIVATPSPERPRVNFQRPETWLIGYFRHDMMNTPPHDEWYNPEYEKYIPDEGLVHKITATNVSDVSVLIVLGSWCPDSHREVPRFHKIIDECGLQRIKVTYLGVDMNKIAPIGNYEELNIKRVPTFIVYRNNIETGRIIEYPVTSLEGDLLEILNR
ncbi:MAG: thioredoxin family protein [Bacteroidales bacterium]